jgi:hypothetical protein
MNPFFIAAVFLGVWSRCLGYCPVCRRYRITRSAPGQKPGPCEVCGTELESVRR